MNQSYDKSAVNTNKQFTTSYFVHLQRFMLRSFNVSSYHCQIYVFWNVRCNIQCACIKHILPSTRLLIWIHERNTTKLNVQVFLRMNNLMFETCRRHYNWIKTLMQKVNFVGSFYIFCYCNCIDEIYRTIILPLFCMGVKLGRWHWRKSVGWGCLRIGCWGEYLGLRGMR